MNILEHFRRQFSYNLWANTEVLAGIRGNAQLLARPLELLGHILSAERLWLERIKHESQSLPVWPELDTTRCETQIAQLGYAWNEYLSKLSIAEFSENIAYKNSRGESWSNTVHDILTHVLSHSAYHRGQIAILVRSSGETPAHTDFIHAARQGLIE
jgi:uncharacterized damage-inducible protein DinB